MIVYLFDQFVDDRFIYSINLCIIVFVCMVNLWIMTNFDYETKTFRLEQTLKEEFNANRNTLQVRKLNLSSK